MGTWIGPQGMVNMFSCLEDEIGIIGEGRLMFAKQELYVENPSDSIHVELIAECSKLSRLKWVNLEVVLLSKFGFLVKGVCHNIHPRDCCQP